MYYKITQVGEKKYEDMGMINIDAAFYLEEGDEGYAAYRAEHYVEVPVIPKEGYTGKVDKEGVPKDSEDYKAWLAKLPRGWQLNPFCNHSMQFEANVTKEEIMYCFDLALPMTHSNYIKGDLLCKTTGVTVNQDISYAGRKLFYKGIKQLAEVDKTSTMKAAEQLITAAAAKTVTLKAIDFEVAKELKVK